MLKIVSNFVNNYNNTIKKYNKFDSISNYLLNDHDFLRYSKQLFLKEVNLNGQQKLQKSTVLIVGLGGLGSPAALYLSAAGIGNLILADNDKVHITNLQRQILYRTNDINEYKTKIAFKELKKLNPNCNYVLITKKLQGDNLIKQVLQTNLVLDCSDNVKTRHEINVACFKNKIPLISGSAIGFKGQLLIMYPSYQNYGCYACLYPKKEEINYNCSNHGILGPIVGIIGTLQALEAIKILINLDNYINKNKTGCLYLFNGLTLKWRALLINRNPKCEVCGNI